MSRYKTLRTWAFALMVVGAVSVVMAAFGVVSWAVNGRTVGTAGADEPLHWPLVRGVHRAIARDAEGRTASVQFIVK